ncbi:uncharacterized protein SPPG_09515 [Spizellomyces punctatus DAOM BR117]|uniref:Uncharacterized protein n=1 Tax=Spizellomyces punctatus (strain DAOM BR117) TaxID=645134 RepID=A0A0L0H7X0_SPIPD|nr:uncharacterized protein SPPG_09515 [Spizellomyces punctatus DAOM BR117]KNC96788.1 hypothetical protein SPPG_09515 [Spizellomyces punctatus DAOM BR117]|eukprot:XP_016604828.1 hypothetical protein SPPG_09515 [Spizellomyces punctatus DAOM BR117]
MCAKKVDLGMKMNTSMEVDCYLVQSNQSDLWNKTKPFFTNDIVGQLGIHLLSMLKVTYFKAKGHSETSFCYESKKKKVTHPCKCVNKPLLDWCWPMVLSHS